MKILNVIIHKYLKNRLVELFKQFIKEYRLLFIILIFSITLSIISPYFLSINNILNILWNVSVVGIMSVGMTFVILTGGIDLSVGSVVCVAGLVAALLFDPGGLNLPITLVLVIFVGILLGCINGLLVALVKITPFLVTLATMAFYRGITLFLTSGQTLGVLKPASFLEIGGGKFLGIPICLLIFFCVVITGIFISEKTIFGRSIYLLGGNKIAARMSGINIKKIEIFAYVISGICASIAGIILTSLVQQAGSNQGQGYELDVIAAVVVGGTSMFGGVGRVINSVLGAIFIGIITNALNILNIPSLYHPIVKGIVILIAVGFDCVGRKKSN